MGVESTPPLPSVGESTPPSLKRVEAPRPQEQEGAPEPPRSGVEGDPITIGQGSGGDRLSKDARSMDEEVEASPVTKQSLGPSGSTPSRRRRRKRKSRRRGNSCRRGSNSRSRKEKKERRGGGNKGTDSRSCWSKTGSRSCRSSRGSSSSKRVSS